MSRKYHVYIMSSKSGVLYIGSTRDLDRRVFVTSKAYSTALLSNTELRDWFTLKNSITLARWLGAKGSSRDGPEEGSSN